MPNAIAFFPWVYVETTRELGAIRLLPYLKGSRPGDLPRMSQRDIDGVLSAYANRPAHPVRRAAILELQDWQTGSDPDPVLSKLFQVRECIVAAMLAHRRLFCRDVGYCNADAYELVVQRYEAGRTGTFAFASRRRDGSTQYLWTSAEFAFHRPIHVDERARVDLDEALLGGLLGLPESYDWIREAIAEFNNANTDYAKVPERVELVMLKSAFEWLLGAGSDRNSMNKKLLGFIGELLPREAWPDRPGTMRWRDRYLKAERPLTAWVTEFCAKRGVAAHARDRARNAWLWSDGEHLAFGAVLFPLLLKWVLARERLMQVEARDIERLRRIELMLEHDPLSKEANAAEHPWHDLDIYARIDASLAGQPRP